MRAETRELLLEIARDDEFGKAYAVALSDVLAGRGKTSDDGAYIAAYAHAVTMSSAGFCKASDMQLPEPWNGDIENCRVLFIGTNPSVDPQEMYPTANWSDDDIVSYFTHRFPDYARKPDMGERWSTLRRDGNWRMGDETNKTWRFAYDASRYLLKSDGIVPGREYAMTEAVHVKTLQDPDLSDAYKSSDRFCKWLDRILMVAEKVEYIVAYGKVSKRMIEKLYFGGLEQSLHVIIPKPIEGRNVSFLFWGHPSNAGDVRSYEKIRERLECGDAPTGVRITSDDFLAEMQASGLLDCDAVYDKTLWVWPRGCNDGGNNSQRNVCIKWLGDKGGYYLRVWTKDRAIADPLLSSIQKSFTDAAENKKLKKQFAIDVMRLSADVTPAFVVEKCKQLQRPLKDCGFWC